MIPIALILLVIASPFILYFLLIKAPIDSAKKRKFLRRNEGKTILCVTTSPKYDVFKDKFLNELTGIGIQDVVPFNCEIPNNMYDNYEWDGMIARGNGFPVLVTIRRKSIEQTSMKEDFHAFFKRKIDATKLIGSIKWKMKQNSQYEQH